MNENRVNFVVQREGKKQLLPLGGGGVNAVDT